MTTLLSRQRPIAVWFACAIYGLFATTIAGSAAESLPADASQLIDQHVAAQLKAAGITASLRALDPVDPVKFDFSICHLGMMNACGFGRKAGDSRCPLKGTCHPF